MTKRFLHFAFCIFTSLSASSQLVAKFAEMLGGSIEVKSEIGKGSTFTLTLPSTYTG